VTVTILLAVSILPPQKLTFPEEIDPIPESPATGFTFLFNIPNSTPTPFNMSSDETKQKEMKKTEE
jgi:hypothetical protein